MQDFSPKQHRTDTYPRVSQRLEQLTVTEMPSSAFYLQQVRQANGAINLSQFELIAGGGTHDIYRLKSEIEPSYLLKVMKQTVGIEAAELQQAVEKLSNQYGKLYEIFGENRCLVEHRSIEDVVSDEETSSQKAIVSLVLFHSCYESKEKFGFNVEPAEVDEVTINQYPRQYIAMNAVIMSTDLMDESFSYDDFFIFHKEFKALFAMLETDVKLQMLMLEFLEKYKAFYKETGVMIDLVGRDNVLFYKAAGQWHFKVGSIIKHDTRSLTIETLAEVAVDPSPVKSSCE